MIRRVSGAVADLLERLPNHAILQYPLCRGVVWVGVAFQGLWETDGGRDAGVENV